jgi:hypothetical protein
MTTKCIDLQDQFGEDYQIGLDESADGRADPWHLTVLCERGEIYPFGGDFLAVEIIGHPVIARQVADIDGVRLHQDGDGEKTYVFHAELFHLVAAFVRPRRRRKLSDEDRDRLVQAGACYRFTPGHSSAAEVENHLEPAS